MVTDKLETLVGFAMKAGKVIYGTDNIERSGKKHLILLCNTLSENSRKKLIHKVEKTPILLSTQKLLSEITHREGCKALAITDRQMANAIIENKNGSYRFITEVE